MGVELTVGVVASIIGTIIITVAVMVWRKLRRWRNWTPSFTEEDVYASGSMIQGPTLTQQLPPDLETFVGRESQINSVIDALTGDSESSVSPLVLITGMAGVGKSALAVHVAHGLKNQFPDGQMYVDFGGDENRRTPFDALGDILLALGIAVESLPNSQDARTSVYRSLMTKRAALILLDNVSYEAQVRPFIVSTSSCAVLATSRRIFPALDSTNHIDLPTMTEVELVKLFQQVLGDQITSKESEAVRHIIGLCGCLPLAVSIALGRIRHERVKQDNRLALYASRLADEKRRLDRLKSGDTEIRASFTVSYDGLSKRAARLFCLLSLVHGPSIELGIAGALMNIALDDAQDVLDELWEHNLLIPVDTRRYRFHDLMMLFAMEKFAELESSDSAVEAEVVFAHWYAAISARMLSLPKGEIRENTDPSVWPSDDYLRDSGVCHRASLWFGLEYPNLRSALDYAAQHRQLGDLHALILNLRGYFSSRALWTDWEDAENKLLLLSRDLTNEHCQASAQSGLGRVYLMQGRWQDALDVLNLSLEYAQKISEKSMEADILTSLGNVYLRQGRWEEVERVQSTCAAIYRSLGDRGGEAVALSNLAPAYIEQEKWEEAERAYKESLSIFEALGDDEHRARVLSGIANVYRSQGKSEQAIPMYQESLGIANALGLKFGVINTNANMALALADTGDSEAAIEILQRAISDSHAIGNHEGEAKGHLNLGILYLNGGDWDLSLAALHVGSRIFQELGDVYNEARVQEYRGLAYREKNDVPSAIHTIEAAAGLYDEAGYRGEASQLMIEIGGIYLETGNVERSIHWYTEALSRVSPDSEVYAELAAWLEATSKSINSQTNQDESS